MQRMVQRKGAGGSPGQYPMHLKQRFHDGAAELERLLLASLGTSEIFPHHLGSIRPDGAAELVNRDGVLLMSRDDAEFGR